VLLSLDTPEANEILSKYGKRIKWAQREYFIAETARSSDAVFIERLRRILGDSSQTNRGREIFGYSPERILDKLIAKTPPQRLLPILEGGNRLDLLDESEVESFFDMLSVRSIVFLFNNTPAASVEPVFARKAVLDKVRFTLCRASATESMPGYRELFDVSASRLIAFAFQHDRSDEVVKEYASSISKLIELEYYWLIFSAFRAGPFPKRIVKEMDDFDLRELWMEKPQYFAEVAEKEAPRVYSTAGRLVKIFCGDRNEKELGKIARQLFEKFDDEQLWGLVDYLLRKYALVGNQGEILNYMLRKLNHERMVKLVTKYFDTGQIEDYWHRFPEYIQDELKQQGRAPRKRPSSKTFPVKVYDSLSVLVRKFAFNKGMTYKQAQSRYWAFAKRWNTDNPDNDPNTIDRELFKELNQAWQGAKTYFQND
jgi:hypothetical protein